MNTISLRICAFCFPVYSLDMFYQPKEYLEVAEKAASFIRSRLYDEHTGRLHHSFRNGPSKAPGFLDDYAFLISGLLDLYEFGGGTNWLSWAIELQATQASSHGIMNIWYDPHICLVQ